MQLRDLTERLRGKLKSNDNLHFIAIENIKDEALLLRKWWHKKYRIPPKPLDEYTYEELFIEQLEDYYLGDASRVETFLSSVGQGKDEWDGEAPPEVEQTLEKRRENSKGRIDKYKTEDEEISEEEFNKMMDNVGYNLPGSKKTVDQGSAMSDEFEETFL